MILSIELSNWKSHSYSKLEFKKGVNVLLGKMGAGKSAVLDALCFALYGTFPKMSRRDQTTDSIVNMHSNAPFAQVSLLFSVNGKEYLIVRKIGGKISEAEIRCQGRLIQKGAKQVTEFVGSLLGVDYELFTKAIYSEQNRLDSLLSLPPRARKQEIDWLLGLGDFDSAKENAQAIISKLQEQSQFFLSEASPSRISELEKKAAEYQSEEKKIILLCGELEKKKQAVFFELKEAKSRLSLLEEAKSQWTSAKAKCDMLRGRLEALSKELAGKSRPSKEDMDKLLAAKKGAEEKLLFAKNEAAASQSKLLSARSELAVAANSQKQHEEKKRKKCELEKKAASLSRGESVLELESRLSSIKSEIERISENKQKLIAESQELKKAGEILSAAQAKCPVCGSVLQGGKAQEMAEGKRQLSEAKAKEAALLEKELSQRQKLLSELEKRISELRLCMMQVDALSIDEAAKEELDARFEKAKSEANSAEIELKRSEEALFKAQSSLEDAKKAYDDALQAAKLFEELELSKKELECEQSKLNAIGHDEEKYRSAQKAVEGLSVSLAQVEAELNGERKRLKLAAEIRQSSEQELKALMAKAAIGKKYAEACEQMSIFKNSLVSAQAELRQALISEINFALAQIWPAIYPYSDYDAVMLEADEKDYRLMMHKDGWKNVDSIASGGERACLCLAFRVALASVLTPNIGWLILDEPTHNLDSEAVSLLSEAINTKIPSVVEQTFIITHDPALGESSEGRVFRLDRDKSVGESTRIEIL